MNYLKLKSFLFLSIVMGIEGKSKTDISSSKQKEQVTYTARKIELSINNRSEKFHLNYFDENPNPSLNMGTPLGNQSVDLGAALGGKKDLILYKTKVAVAISAIQQCRVSALEINKSIKDLQSMELIATAIILATVLTSNSLMATILPLDEYKVYEEGISNILQSLLKKDASEEVFQSLNNIIRNFCKKNVITIFINGKVLELSRAKVLFENEDFIKVLSTVTLLLLNHTISTILTDIVLQYDDDQFNKVFARAKNNQKSQVASSTSKTESNAKDLETDAEDLDI